MLADIKREVIETGEGKRAEVRTTINGAAFYYDLVVEPTRDASGAIAGIIGSAADVTERKRTEEVLREEQQHKLDFYRRTIEAATSGKLIVTDRPQIEKIAGPPLATWEIHSREDIQAVRHGVEHLARDAGIKEPRLGKLTVAVGEAVTNAIKHAQSGDASFHRADDFIVVLVSDRGPGIPAVALPDVALRPGYSTAGTLGMGYKMMIQFSDKVCLATGDQGTTVGIEMKLG